MTIDREKEIFISLTPRERECLYWIAKGKSCEETALILNIKIATVKFYREQIKAKLNSINLAQAVYEGMKMGYLNMS